MKKLTIRMLILSSLCLAYGYANAAGADPKKPGNSCSASGANGSSCDSGTCTEGTIATCSGSDTGQPSCSCRP